MVLHFGEPLSINLSIRVYKFFCSSIYQQRRKDINWVS
ncbi:hypothetical protein [Sulfolobus spindle-shaped virus]|nr:hypothetical protein [Sulfolobus spindle-shaped virus]